MLLALTDTGSLPRINAIASPFAEYASLDELFRQTYEHEQLMFHTCSAENLSAAQLVAFLEKKGKFIAREEGFTTAENKICRH